MSGPSLLALEVCHHRLIMERFEININYYKIISFSNFRQRTTNPFNSLVLLSSPADAVMMSELKSFTAIMQHLKFTKKFKITKLTYTCTNMPLW